MSIFLPSGIVRSIPIIKLNPKPIDNPIIFITRCLDNTPKIKVERIIDKRDALLPRSICIKRANKLVNRKRHLNLFLFSLKYKLKNKKKINTKAEGVLTIPLSKLILFAMNTVLGHWLFVKQSLIPEYK